MSVESAPETIIPAHLSAEQFLDDPASLRASLETHGALDFTPYASGLFPAISLSSEVAEATGMDMAWLRDNAHIANALYEAGRADLAVPVGKAFLRILHNNRDVLDGVVSGTDPTRRLPVRVHGDTLENDTEARVQHDATGYALWLVGRFIREGQINPATEDLDVLAQTVRYLGAIEYWRERDHGHWEEDKRLNASSIGAVLAGLKMVQDMFRRRQYPHAIEHPYRHGIDIDWLVEQGADALQTMLHHTPSIGEPSSAPWLPAEKDIAADAMVLEFFKKFDPSQRQYDASMLFLAEPLDMLDDSARQLVVRGIEERLVRHKGTSRYPGDTYWGPLFDDLMGIQERTFSTEGRTEKRNLAAAGIAYMDAEAQWTLFDPLLACHYGGQFWQSSHPADAQKFLRYLNRSLRQLVPVPGDKLHLSEAFYYNPGHPGADEKGWAPNLHGPILWGQANLLRALLMFEDIANWLPRPAAGTSAKTPAHPPGSAAQL